MKKTILKCYWSGFLFRCLRNFLCECLLVLLTLDCLLCVGSDGDSVCLLGSCRISIPGPAPALGSLTCLLGPGKHFGGEAETNGCESPGLPWRRKRGPCSLIQCCSSPPWGCGEECWAAGCEVKLALEITGAARLPAELPQHNWVLAGTFGAGMGQRSWSRARVCPHYLSRSWRCP